MPLGSTHREAGVILREGDALVLARDDGGQWRLDRTGEIERLLGRRVEIEGVRVGFDELSVVAIAPAGQPLIRRPFVASWEFAIGFAVTLAALTGAIVTIGQLAP